MPRHKYTIYLPASDKKKLKSIISKGVCPARTITRAQILLNLDSSAENRYNTAGLAKLFGVSQTTVNNLKKAYHEKGIGCIYRKKRNSPPVESKVTGEVEAHLIALACHNPPAGYCRWTLRLLSERMVEMNYIVFTELVSSTGYRRFPKHPRLAK